MLVDTGWDEGVSEQTLSVNRHAVLAGGLALDSLDAVYVMRGQYTSPVTDWVPVDAEWSDWLACPEAAIRARQERRSLSSSVYRLLSERTRVVNPEAAYRSCLLLPALLRRLGDAGLGVAEFVSGNDLEQIAYFVHDHGERCRGRRLAEPSWSEFAVDLAYLQAHHLDFDRFPLIVRSSAGGEQLQLLVVAGRYVAGATVDYRRQWGTPGSVSSRAIAHAEAVPLELPLFPDLRALHECAGGGRIATTEPSDLSAIYLRSVRSRSVLAQLDALGTTSASWASRRCDFVRIARLGSAAAEHLGLAWTGMDLIREEASGDYLIL
jgi:hypothetical protein